jgi:NADH dehydrogenase
VPLYCLSLGRKNGVVQRVSRDGCPTGWVLTGRLGAIIKELICRSTLWALRLERRPRSRYLPDMSPRPPAGVPEGPTS